MSRVRIVGLVVGLSVVVIVQKDSTTGNSVDCPVVNAAAVIGGITYEVGAFGLCELDLYGKFDDDAAYSIVKAFAANVANLINMSISEDVDLTSREDLTYMPKSIPLCSTLRVHCVCVVIRNAFDKRFNVVLKHLTVESWCFRHRERKARYQF